MNDSMFRHQKQDKTDKRKKLIPKPLTNAQRDGILSPKSPNGQRKGGEIVAKNLELSGLIHSQYESEAALARHLGWTRQRLNKIVMGAKEPDLEEVNAIAIATKKPLEYVANIFLRRKSPNGQHNNRELAS